MAWHLNEAERALKQAAALGKIAAFEPITRRVSSSEVVDCTALSDKTIRSEFIQMLCRAGGGPVSPKGIRVNGGVIVDRLDLSNCRLKWLLELRQMQIPGGVNLENSRTKTVDLSNSVIGIAVAADDTNEASDDDEAVFHANRVCVDGDLVLNGAEIHGRLEHAAASGACSFSEAAIVGQFIGNKGKFDHPMYAIVAHNCDCSGFSLDEAVVNGTCDISGSTIDGEFAAEGATFNGFEGLAISAFACRMEAWFMRSLGDKPTVVNGMIYLVHARVARDIDVKGASLNAGYHLAIAGRSAVVGGSVFIEKAAKVDGCVHFGRAEIKGQLRLTGSTISSAMLARQRVVDPLSDPPSTSESPSSFRWSRYALDLSEATIGHLTMPDTAQTRPRGIIDLSRTRIGTLTDFKAAWPPKINRDTRDCPGRAQDSEGRDADHLVLDGLEYEHLDNPDGLDQSRRVSVTRIDWLLSQSREDIFMQMRPQPWQQLGKVLAQQGHEDDARAIAIGRRVALRDAEGTPPAAKALSWLLQAVADYGFNPWKTIAWSALIVVLFMIVYALPLGGSANHHGGPHKPLASDQTVFVRTVAADFTPNTSTVKPIDEIYPSFDPLMYSLDVFLPFVDFGMEKYWRANTTTWLGVLLYYLAVLEGTLGAVMISLVVSGFTGLLTRGEV